MRFNLNAYYEMLFYISINFEFIQDIENTSLYTIHQVLFYI